ncbi:hypothetical protein IM538_08020 [Cytobacillus suaedae]|nr:hypothetical protein IM538_08020 [Cytobacillus suaedae]
MIILFYVILNSLAILSLKKLLKFLPPFEILFSWLIVSILGHEFFVIVNLNLKVIENTSSKAFFLLIALNRSVLMPFIVMWLLSLLYHTKSVVYKLLFFFLFIAVLTGAEYMGDWLGLMNHNDWNVWWTVIEWIGIVSLTLLFSRYVKFLYKKEVVY